MSATQSKVTDMPPNAFTSKEGAYFRLSSKGNYYEIWPSDLVITEGSKPPKTANMTEARDEWSKVQAEQTGRLTVEEIAQYMKEAASQTRQLPDPVPAIAEDHEITAEELLNRNVETIPCLIEPIIQRVGLAAVAGSSDVGKSAFLRQLAFAVASGEPDFLGFPIRARHQSAIYVSTEDDEQATAYLLHSLNKTRQRAATECGRLRFIFDTHNLPAQLDKRLTSRPADLVVIDAFGDLYGKDQNSSNQIRAFLHEYGQLAQKHQCLILFLHHVGKRTEDEAPSKHHLIGGQGFEGKMRLVIELRLDLHDPTRRHLCLVKGNYLPTEWKQDSFVLDFQNFLFSNTGDRVPFVSLARPKDAPDEGTARYKQIQQARALGYRGDALAKHLGWSKGYISQIEKKFGPKDQPTGEFTES